MECTCGRQGPEVVLDDEGLCEICSYEKGFQSLRDEFLQEEELARSLEEQERTKAMLDQQDADRHRQFETARSFYEARIDMPLSQWRSR